MLKMKTLLVTSALLLVHTAPALADAKDDRIEALEAQMQIMMQEIKSLKEERAVEKIENEQMKQKLSAIETKTEEAVANISPAAGESNSDIKVSMKGPRPKITKGEFSWEPTGRIHLDAGSFSDDKRDHPNGAEFRRARLGMQGQITDDFGYKFEVDLANEDVSFTDVYMNYTGIEGTEIQLGHMKSDFSMDDMASSNDITFIERGAGALAFALPRQIGLRANYNNDKNFHIAGGVFNDNAGTQSSDDEALSFSGRVAGTPIKTDESFIHVGASASYREPDQANDTFDYDSRAENRLQTADSVSSVITDAEDSTVYGLEAAFATGPFSAQGEYVIANTGNRGGQDPTYTGGYGQLAWTVTGERRPYSISKAAFSGIKPDRPLDPANGDWGALELAARYSHLDLNDSGLNGGEMNNITLGANWYLNNYMRLMGNVIFVDTDENATTPNDDPTVFLMRSQVKF
jgi:phosphate-selective porin OprO/OprP